MVNPNRFYTYAYLREDRTPYYIGKGTGKRIFEKRRRYCRPPKDKSRIIFLKQNITEEEAFKHEIYMIAVFGRIDLGTGILHNRTAGGEGASGYIRSEESKRKQSERMKGENNLSYGKKGKDSIKYGKKHSKESRKKQSEEAKGKSHSKETKRKMSEANKGEKNYLSKLWKITKNTGEEILVWGLYGWGKENNYHQNGLYSVYTGKYKKHKDVIKVEVVE